MGYFDKGDLSYIAFINDLSGFFVVSSYFSNDTYNYWKRILGLVNERFRLGISAVQLCCHTLLLSYTIPNCAGSWDIYHPIFLGLDVKIYAFSIFWGKVDTGLLLGRVPE